MHSTFCEPASRVLERGQVKIDFKLDLVYPVYQQFPSKQKVENLAIDSLFALDGLKHLMRQVGLRDPAA